MNPPSGGEKTNPIKPNFKPDDGFSAYYTRDCRVAEFTLSAPVLSIPVLSVVERVERAEGGLPMTFLGAFLQSVARAKLVFWIFFLLSLGMMFCGIDLAVEGIAPGRFFRFYGDLLFGLSKPVDLIDLSDNTKFNRLVYRERIRIYGRSGNLNCQ